MTAAQLKAAILDLAIHGKLVPQDPNDEPAEVLLSKLTYRQSVSATRKTDQRHNRGRGGNCKFAAVPVEEQPFDVPNGWKWVRLGELVEVVTSGSREWAKYYSNSGDLFLRMGNLSRDSFELRLDTIQHVQRPANSEGERTSLQAYDLLFSITAEIGLLGLIPEGFGNAYINQHTALIRFLPEFRGRYLPYVLLAPYLRPIYNNEGHGLKSSFRLDTIFTFPVPLPPLAEQKRIVAKIDELMPLVERYADAESRRIKFDESVPTALVKSVLKSAFDGELTPGCDFEERTLDDVCADVFTGNSLSDEEKKKFTRADGLPFIGTKDVGFDQVIDYENGIRIPVSESRYRTAPSGATLLCVEGGSSGRKIGLVDRDVRFGNKLCAFVPGTELEAKYLFLYLQSPQFLDQFSELQNGPRKGAGVKQVKALTITMTDKGTQKQIVQKVEQLLLHVGRVGVRTS